MHNTNAAGQTHDQLQAACWKAAQQLYWPFLDQRLFCIPNDMHAGNVARWKQYEALGVTPGVWDMQLLWFEEMYPPLKGQTHGALLQATHWFEFKVGRDKLSVTRVIKGRKVLGQTEFMNNLLPLGHKFHIISEQEQFMSIMETIVKPTLDIAKEIFKEECNGKTRCERK